MRKLGGRLFQSFALFVIVDVIVVSFVVFFRTDQSGAVVLRETQSCSEEPSFRPCPLKGCISHRNSWSSTVNSYFDAVYVLNLDRVYGRWLQSEAILRRLGIYGTRFRAVDGADKDVIEAFEQYQKRPLDSKWEQRIGRKAIISSGALAHTFSFKEMVLDAQRNRFERILVLEDDFLPISNFNEEFDKVVNALSRDGLDDWVIFYLGASQFHWRSDFVANVTEPYYVVNKVDGSFAVAFHESIYQNLLDEADKLVGAFDVGPMRSSCNLHPGKCVVANPNLFVASFVEPSMTMLKKRNISALAATFRWDLTKYAPRIATVDAYPLISCFVPICHEADYLEMSVLSLRNQTYPKKEIVIVDHCDDSKVLKVARNLVSRYGNVLHYRTGKLPEEQALVSAVSIASGTILSMSPPGSFSFPSRLWKQAEPILSNRALLTAATSLRTHRARLPWEVSPEAVWTAARESRLHKRRGGWMPCCAAHRSVNAVMFAREVIDKVGPFDDVHFIGDESWLTTFFAEFGTSASDMEKTERNLVNNFFACAHPIPSVYECVGDILVIEI